MKQEKFFKVLFQSKKSKARLGEIRTDHGVIKTPAFVPVATKGTIKSLWPELVKEIGIQVAFVNTYHLIDHPGAEVLAKIGGIHHYANLKIPLMSDSGGFQVFSLGRGKNKILDTVFLGRLTPDNARGNPQAIVSKKSSSLPKTDNNFVNLPLLLKISEDGVKFRSTFDGRLIEFTPERSMEYQRQIGADIIMAFDECISYGVDYRYAKEATERTHRWLERCIKKSQKSKVNSQNHNLKLKRQNVTLFRGYKSKFINNQYLYGVIQGGAFEGLRKKSAQFVVDQPVDGVAIGGVSVGESKREMRDQVRWVADYLPNDRPVHLLGVGQFDDILDLVKYGVDTFDCVEPTRLARMGTIYQLKVNPPIRRAKFKVVWEEIDILRGKYRDDLSPVDKNCSCCVCQNFTKSYLHHLFKQKELLGYSLATYHNLWVMERFFEKIREIIENGLM